MVFSLSAYSYFKTQFKQHHVTERRLLWWPGSKTAHMGPLPGVPFFMSTLTTASPANACEQQNTAAATRRNFHKQHCSFHLSLLYHLLRGKAAAVSENTPGALGQVPPCQPHEGATEKVGALVSNLQLTAALANI